jgi:alginate O-acetyltransferase complex protein AlgI
MAFTDLRYLLFLGLVTVMLPLFPRGNTRLFVSGLVGLGFYINLVPNHWYVLVAVSVTAYVGGLVVSTLADGRVRSAAFLVSVVATLLPLLTFKYAASLYAFLPPASNVATRWSLMANLILPIGNSFYTFLAVGYLIDVYIGSVPAERNATRFGACMWFFPHLTAGPIERSRHLLPQLENIGQFDYSCAVSGLRAILIGLFMKVVIADTLAPYVDLVYANPRQHGAIDLALATVFFSFQVYADFAGYSLIAIGSARLLGVELLTNFMQPWLSQNLPDFWRRWHISLSSWFRDYVFMPLQFQARRWRAYGLAGALIFTFMLVGIWHGAGIKFALFGLIHGALVAFSTMTFARRDKYWRSLGIPRLLLMTGRAVATFLIVSLSFVLFRAHDVSDAFWIYKTIVSGAGPTRTGSLFLPLSSIALLIGGDLFVVLGVDLRRLSTWSRWVAYYAAVVCIAAATFNHALKASSYDQQFIYFKF